MTDIVITEDSCAIFKYLPVEVSAYKSIVDRVPVVHIDTPDLDENENGPILRIYLNDAPVFQNPPLEQP